MAISKRKTPTSPHTGWTPYLRVWRMVALLVVIGLIIYQRYQVNQARVDAQKRGDLNANGVDLPPGEHHVDIQIMEEEPEGREKVEGETTDEAPADKPEPEEPAEQASPPQKPLPKTRPQEPSEESSSDGATGSSDAGPITVIKNVQVRNNDGKVVYQGNVDVSKTLHRIEAGEHLRFPNDGVVFQNRERRLPIKGAGYYREWVHPTPKIDGPGPQRIVTGKEGELYYTHDHYRTFKPLHRR